MIRTLSLGAILAASCAAGALAVAPASAYVAAHFTAAAIDVQAHAQGVAAAMLAFGACLVGFVLSGLPPFADEVAQANRAHAEGYAAVAGALEPAAHRYINTPTGRRKQDIATGRFVAMGRGKTRRRSDRVAVGEGA